MFEGANYKIEIGVLALSIEFVCKSDITQPFLTFSLIISFILINLNPYNDNKIPENKVPKKVQKKNSMAYNM
jgi:hypothetical protein